MTADIYFDSIKDCYEAFTIYSFLQVTVSYTSNCMPIASAIIYVCLQLLLSYIGSESAVCDHYREKTEM